ncbi:MAG TPA: CoA pyrophosphatase [Thermoplasmata archaeon]|jgi:8-oxo-dGTP pyrophosphatase MutT (NUDIX family)
MSSSGSGERVPGTAPETLSELLSRFPALAPPISIAGAAVVIVLRDGRAEVEALLIERAERAEDPASGQVAFPGGHVADGDGSLAVTALRELEEEVGLSRADLAGELRYVNTVLAIRFGLKVAVFATALAPDANPPTARSAEEVAHVFWLPRSALATSRPIVRETSRGLAEVRSTVFERHVLWGFSRRVLCQFFGVATEDEFIGPVFPPRLPPPDG